MEYQTVSRSCVALLVHKGISRGEAAASLVRSALELYGLDIWPCMEVDLFPSEEETLILARPSDCFCVTVADYALPYLPES